MFVLGLDPRLRAFAEKPFQALVFEGFDHGLVYLYEIHLSRLRKERAARRDPAFREKVLLAYEYRCCVCGHNLRMGGDDTKAKLLAHHGAGLIEPQGRECLPHPEFLAWHRAEVFKEPARE